MVGLFLLLKLHIGIAGKCPSIAWFTLTNSTPITLKLQIDNIRRGYDDSTSLLCIPDKEKLNYQYDISIILDDTLIFNISQFKLSWVKDGRQWGGIGGPMEYCIVSSVNVNGHTSNDTTKAGELAFSHNFIKTKKR